MAGGLAFDPAEFAAFKSGRGSDRSGQGEAPAVAFNPDEFKAFKERAVAPRSPSPASTPASFDDRFGSGPMASTLDTATPLGAGPPTDGRRGASRQARCLDPLRGGSPAGWQRGRFQLSKRGGAHRIGQQRPVVLGELQASPRIRRKP